MFEFLQNLINVEFCFQVVRSVFKRLFGENKIKRVKMKRKMKKNLPIFFLQESEKVKKCFSNLK